MIDSIDQQAMYDYYNKRPAVGDSWGPPGAIGGQQPGPERDQLAADDQRRFATDLAEWMRDRRVLELACGTGCSTAIVAETVRSVLATELTPAPLQLAIARGLPAEKVRFAQWNAFDLLAIPGNFDALVATGFFDHVPKIKSDVFLFGVAQRVGPGGRVFLSGSQWTDRAKRLRVYRESCADTYMRRSMQDGTEYLILDNEFTAAELQEIFSSRGDDVPVCYGFFRWWVRYSVP